MIKPKQHYPKNNLFNAFKERSQVCIKRLDGSVHLCTTEELDIANRLKRIEEITKRVARSKGSLFKYKRTPNSPACYLESGILAQEILALLKCIKPIQRHYMYNLFNPYVKTFIESAELRNINLEQDIWLHNQEVAIIFVAMLNDFVSGVREKINDKAFETELSSHLRSVNKNYLELCKYIKALFHNHARLLVVRVDLTYQNRFSKPNVPLNLDYRVENPMVDSDPNFVRDHKNLYLTYPEIKRHRESLLKDLDKKLFKDALVGHAWKLEFGLDKGFHYHMLFMLDGSKVREDVTIGAVIGEHWVNKITEGRGLYWNCNSNKGSYRHCGIGMIHADDADALKGLEYAAYYMCKVDYYIKAVAPHNGRTFGKGNMPEPKSNSGRPRNSTKVESI